MPRTTFSSNQHKALFGSLGIPVFNIKPLRPGWSTGLQIQLAVAQKRDPNGTLASGKMDQNRVTPPA